MIGGKSTEKPQCQLVDQRRLTGSSRTTDTVDFCCTPGTNATGGLRINVFAGLDLAELHRNDAVLERSVHHGRHRDREPSLDITHHFFERGAGKKYLVDAVLIHYLRVSLSNGGAAAAKETDMPAIPSAEQRYHFGEKLNVPSVVTR